MPGNTLERRSYGLEAKLAHIDITMAVRGNGGWSDLGTLLSLSHITTLSQSLWILYVFALLSVGTRTSPDLEI